MKKFYISTPIFYPNGNLHLGHLYSMTIAWSLKNYKKLKNYQTILVTGSDEHGQKIAEIAKKNHLTPQEFVDKQSEKFKYFWKKYHIDYDIFIRTSDSKHINTIKNILFKMKKDNYIYKDFYEGLYSISDEEFLTKIQAIKKNNKYYHPTSNHELSLVKEESYFLKIKIFQKWLLNYIEKNTNFIPSKKVVNELKNTFLNNNLENLSISRNTFDWGINFPFDKEHVTYVWVDALFSYLSPLGLYQDDKKFNEFWNKNTEKIHVVGKEITRFHCIYWPIMLKMLNLDLPNTILSHGWLVTSTGKMSKSKNNVIDPLKLLEKNHYEIIKLYLMASFNIERDGIFDEKNIDIFYNAFLVNNYGNLLSRVSAMYEQNFESSVLFNQNDLELLDKNILNNVLKYQKKYEKNFDNFLLDKAIDNVFELGNILNNYIDVTKPWLLKKDKKRLSRILIILLNGIFAMTLFLNPFMPEITKNIFNNLKINNFSFDDISIWNKFDQIFIKKISLVFPRKK